jgi:hypothetical protein
LNWCVELAMAYRVIKLCRGPLYSNNMLCATPSIGA